MNENKVEEIRQHIEAVFNILELDKTQSNIDTPLRVAKMYCNELFKNRNNNNIEELNSSMKLFDYVSRSGIKQPVTVKGIEFHSTCEHHWLPFMGTATISYMPSDKIIGLSKIPRVVKYFSQKPQLQERLTDEIGEYLFNLLQPEWLSVELVATHTCVICRGTESNCETETQYFKSNDHRYSDGFMVTTTGGITPV